MKNLAIIPARGGSKRLKNKNIKIFFGKPILQRTFELIKKSNLFDKIILTTDSKSIKLLGRKLGFDLIINRNKKLSGNQATTIEVIKDAIIKCDKLIFHNVCCIYPCNPLIKIKDLKKSLKLANKDINKFIFPVCEYPHPTERAFYLKGKKNYISFLNKKNANRNTQSFKKNYHDAGQFYWAKKSVWLKSHSIHNNSIGYKIPKYRTIDIDDYEDWLKAKVLFKGLKYL